MAFESLSEKFQKIIKTIKGQSKLTEKNMDDMLKEVRIALLEADVNFKVVKSFVNNVKEKALGQEVYLKLNPSQMVVKIVRDELEALLGGDTNELYVKNNDLSVYMMVGLQGSGKTTTAGKLAKYLKEKEHKKVLLSACDVYRPAAIDQLVNIGKKIGVEVVNMGTNVDPVEIAKKSYEKAKLERYDVLIIDTAGRLQIDEVLMEELNNIKKAVDPQEILLLVDAMAGQDAVNVATAFHEKLTVTGAIMSKLDGDARGGAALSIKQLSDISIKFIGTGEKLTDLDKFHPDRMAERILGMGDILTLVEKVEQEIDKKEMEKQAKQMMDGEFTLDDMLKQMKQIQKLGSMSAILKMIPGMPKITPEQQEMAEREMKNFEVIINSMTKEERRNPDILKNSRKVRIAKGSGKTAHDINMVLKKYEQMKETMKQMKGFKKGGKFPPMNGLF